MADATTERTAHLRDLVVRREEERVDFLRRLVQIPSVTGEEGAIQEIIADAFARAGLEVHIQEIDFARVAPYLEGTIDQDFAGRPNVIGRLRGTGGGRSLLLNAHVDTVVAGEESRWRFPPFSGEVADGRVWGRGACDMKASLVACLYAAIAVQDAHLPLAGDLIIAATVGEESGGAGAVACALDWKADAAIVTEPTSLAVAPAHAGSSQLRITLEGESAHACVRDVGVSAIEKFVALFRELAEYERERNGAVSHPLFAGVSRPAPLNVGLVQGGEWPSMVPERVVAGARIGFLPGEDFDGVKADFQKRIADWAARDAWLAAHPPAVEWAGSQFPPSEISVDSEIVQTVVDSFAAAVGRSPAIRGMTYGTDMHHFLEVGRMPTLLFGPGDIARAHRTDEFVPISELHSATRVLAATIANWCGGDRAGRGDRIGEF